MNGEHVTGASEVPPVSFMQQAEVVLHIISIIVHLVGIGVTLFGH